MSGGILVYAEQSDGAVREAARQVAAAAVGLKADVPGPVTVVVVGANPEALAAEVDLPGIDAIAAVPVADEAIQPDALAMLLETLIADRRPTLTLAAFSVDGMAVGARVAIDLGLAFASNVASVSVSGAFATARRSVLGGKVIEEVELPLDAGALVLLRVEGPPVATAPGGAPVTRLPVAVDPAAARTRHLAYETSANDNVGLARANVIVTVGRGVTDRDDIEVFRKLASRLGAALGSSRPLIDAGWMPRSAQVGQSGTVVKPRVYLAFGVSGASEHLAGMRGSETIVAVNTDPRAPIFGIADYGAVADAVEVAEELERAW